MPGHEELGVGAIAEGLDEPVLSERAQRSGIGGSGLVVLIAAARQEVARRVRYFRRGRALPDLGGRDVLLVDDGLATGVTAEAALRALREQRPRRLVLAVPVSAPETERRLRAFADDVVCVELPTEFHAVGCWYADFTQVSDAQVLDLLNDRTNQRG
jgi:putative phosphoribosyl transferase